MTKNGDDGRTSMKTLPSKANKGARKSKTFSSKWTELERLASVGQLLSEAFSQTVVAVATNFG